MAPDTFLRAPAHRAAPGAHSTEFFAGRRFATLHDDEPHVLPHRLLAKHFDVLVWQGLGLDRHPSLLPVYFGNYARLVLLSQADDPAVAQHGRGGASGSSSATSTRAWRCFAAAVTIGLRPGFDDRPRQRNEVVVIMWRDIPAQVNGQTGRQRIG